MLWYIYKIEMEIIFYFSLIFIRVTASKLFQNFVYLLTLIGMSIRYSLQLYCINFSWRGIMLVCSAFICDAKVSYVQV